MGNFYADFVTGASHARQRQMDHQSMQLREDENRRQNEDAQRKTDAAYREEQARTAIEQLDEYGGAGRLPTEGQVSPPGRREIGMFAGAPQREQERVTELEQRKEKLLKSAEILHDKGFYDMSRDMTKQAMEMDTHALDQRIKTLDVADKESDQMSGIAQGVSDQGSFENALSDLLRSGYGQQVKDILEVTGGRYSPEAQQMLNNIMKSSETAKNAQAMDLALLKDGRDAIKQRADLQNQEITQHQRDQEIAIKREKLGPGGVKAGEIIDVSGQPHKMTDLRQEYNSYVARQKATRDVLVEEGMDDMDLEDEDDVADLAAEGISPGQYKEIMAIPVSQDEWISKQLGIPVERLSPGKGKIGGASVAPKSWTPPASAPQVKKEWLTPANIRALAHEKGATEEEVRRRFGVK